MSKPCGCFNRFLATFLLLAHYMATCVSHNSQPVQGSGSTVTYDRFSILVFRFFFVNNFRFFVLSRLEIETHPHCPPKRVSLFPLEYT